MHLARRASPTDMRKHHIAFARTLCLLPVGFQAALHRPRALHWIPISAHSAGSHLANIMRNGGVVRRNGEPGSLKYVGSWSLRTGLSREGRGDYLCSGPTLAAVIDMENVGANWAPRLFQ